jgi:hypothetical protein
MHSSDIFVSNRTDHLVAGWITGTTISIQPAERGQMARIGR